MDSECAGGLVCANGPDIAPTGCAQPCVRDNDCVSVPGAGACVLDRPTGATPRWVCGSTTGRQTQQGDTCTRDGDCASNVCIDRVCRAACGANADCLVPGMTCATLPAAPSLHVCGADPVTGTTVEYFTMINDSVSVDHGQPSVFWLAPDAVSFAIVAQEVGGTELLASVPILQAPDATYWINGNTWSILREQPIREILAHAAVNSVLAPSSDTLRVLPGRYNVQTALFNDRSAMTNVTDHAFLSRLLVKRAPGGMLPASGNLNLRLWFVGISGINASNAASNARLQGAIAAMRSAYAQVGITVQVAGYQDITGADATRLTVIDSEAEMRDLFAHSTPDAPNINMFFVQGISASAGLEGAIGVAGDIVGPVTLAGTVSSGVVVGWSTTGPGSNMLGQVMAHEAGHYLGLWHVQESQAPCTATGQTMCSFWGGADPISDTPSGSAGSGYLMFWSTADGSNRTISRGQGVVMRSNPLIQ